MRLLYLIFLGALSSGVGDKLYRTKIESYKAEIENGEWMQVPSPGILGLKQTHYKQYSEKSGKKGMIYWRAYRKVIIEKNNLFNDGIFSCATIEVPEYKENKTINKNSQEDSLFTYFREKY